MRKLIMWNLVSLDGCFEGAKSWDLPWHERVWGEELERFSIEQLQSADMLLFGRATYEGMAAYWEKEEGEIADYMNKLPKRVCSRTLREPAWNNTTLISDDVRAEVARLKQEGSGNILVFGSADLSRTLVDEALFDEYRIAIAPVIHGRGRQLFSERALPQQLELLDTRALSNGCVILRYRQAPGARA